MNRVLPLLSLCIGLLALAFALVPRGEVVVASVQQDPPRIAEADPELRRRLEQLEDENRMLWDRVVLLERRQVTVTSSDAGVLVAPSINSELAQLREEVRGLITGEVLGNPASRSALKEVIREAEADSQRERSVLRQQRTEQRALEQKARWKEFATAAKLTYAQEQELTRRLEAEDAARKALSEQLQNGPPNPEAFRTLRDQRRETDQAMGKLLDDAQKEQYQALRREDRGGGARGERGGGEQLR